LSSFVKPNLSFTLGTLSVFLDRKKCQGLVVKFLNFLYARYRRAPSAWCDCLCVHTKYFQSPKFSVIPRTPASPHLDNHTLFCAPEYRVFSVSYCLVPHPESPFCFTPPDFPPTDPSFSPPPPCATWVHSPTTCRSPPPDPHPSEFHPDIVGMTGAPQQIQPAPRPRPRPTPHPPGGGGGGGGGGGCEQVVWPLRMTPVRLSVGSQELGEGFGWRSPLKILPASAHCNANPPPGTVDPNAGP